MIDGYHGDAARTFAVGNISEEAQKLIEVTKESFFKGFRVLCCKRFRWAWNWKRSSRRSRGSKLRNTRPRSKISDWYGSSY